MRGVFLGLWVNVSADQRCHPGVKMSSTWRKSIWGTHAEAYLGEEAWTCKPVPPWGEAAEGSALQSRGRSQRDKCHPPTWGPV